MKVLLDNDIVSKAELAELTKKKEAWWGGKTVEVVGYKKRQSSDASLQQEIDAIVTIGRLIREEDITAYTYSELRLESLRRKPLINAFYALDGCRITTCPAPIERSKFRQTGNFIESISKGGKKDRKLNKAALGEFNQIPFFKWLLDLDPRAIQSILMHTDKMGVSKFEAESFRQLDRFKFICDVLGNTPENYPDAFHLWTAERNNIAVFLTLEKRLVNAVENAEKSKKYKQPLRVSVLRPLTLLKSLGISVLDEMPIKAGRFYTFMEACEYRDSLKCQKE